MYIENPGNLFVIKKMANAVAVIALEDATLNDNDLKKGDQYNINFGTFGAIAGREYFINKGLLKYLPNKEKELLDILVKVIKRN